MKMRIMIIPSNIANDIAISQNNRNSIFFQNRSALIRNVKMKRFTCMEISADHLFAVNGVEASQKASFCVVTVQLGICPNPRVLHQLVTPAIPWDPTVCTLRFFIYKILCREGARQIEDVR